LKRLFLISQVFYPDQVSTAGLFTNLCSVLAEKDYTVEVWAAQPSYSVRNRQPRRIVYNGISICYLPSTNFPKTRILGRIINTLTFTASVFLKLLFSKEKTTVFTHTTPPLLGILISFVCVLKKRKLVYILLDIFPEGLVRLGNFSGKNPFILLWQSFFLTTLRRCDKIVVLGRDMKSWIDQIYPSGKSKVVYIPVWQNDKLISPIDFNDNKLVSELKLEDKFVVQYSGNMGIWNEMKTLGLAVRMNPDNVIFMFIGDGIRKKELFNVFRTDYQNNVIELPFQPESRLNTVLTACHVGLVTMKSGLEGMAVPCKIFGILAAGIPVIALVPELSEIGMIVKEENCGIVIDPLDLDGFLEAIRKLKNDEQLRNIMGENGRKAFEKKYCLSIIAESYKELLNSIN
jgi:colanic acid biosynthesis glycosyl transferase WcaI